MPWLRVAGGGIGRTFPAVVMRVQCCWSDAIPLLQPCSLRWGWLLCAWTSGLMHCVPSGVTGRSWMHCLDADGINCPLQGLVHLHLASWQQLGAPGVLG